MSLFASPAKLVLDDAKADGLAVGQELLVYLMGDDTKAAERIRNDYTPVASGLCNTKNKRIGVYMAPDGKLYGVSEARPGWHFRVKRSVLE